MTDSQQFGSPAAVVFDLEFTAWEGSMANHWLRPGEFQEIVQIGAVQVDADFNCGKTFDTLVRPRINPEISPYLERLPGITNEAMRARQVRATAENELRLRRVHAACSPTADVQVVVSVV